MTIHLVMMARHHPVRSDGPPVAGMSAEVWTWLRESDLVRPAAVAQARARLDAGVGPTSFQLAEAMLRAAV